MHKESLKEEFNKDNCEINWKDCWENVLEEIKPNSKVTGELVKQTGGEKIRQNVEILISQAA